MTSGDANFKENDTDNDLRYPLLLAMSMMRGRMSDKKHQRMQETHIALYQVICGHIEAIGDPLGYGIRRLY